MKINLMVFCDAEYPSYDAMDYQPDQLQMVIEAPPPPVVDPPPAPDIDTEVPPIPSTEEIECPAPNQPRVGDLTQNGEERVIGHEIQNGQCVVLYEETTAVEKFLPSTNQVSTTAAIAVVSSTASAAATPLLLRVIKPVIKKLTTTIQKKFGKEPPKLSRNELNCNKYREKKGLPPFKRPKKKENINSSYLSPLPYCHQYSHLGFLQTLLPNNLATQPTKGIEARLGAAAAPMLVPTNLPVPSTCLRLL